MRSATQSATAMKVVFNCVFFLATIGVLLASPAVLAANTVVTDAGCVLDQPSAPNGINCTANDTTLSSPTITVVNNDYCDYPGDTVLLNVTVDITIGAQTRYDMGVWVAIDGDPNLDGAATGECAALSVPNNILHVDQTTTTLGDGDYCGDVFNVDPDGIIVPPGTTAHILAADLGTFSVPCEDKDGDGKIDVPVIVAWKQSSSNDCHFSNDAVPGTAAKCVADNTFALDVPIPGRIIVDKVTSPSDATLFDFNLSGPVSPAPGGFDGSEDFQLSDASDPYDTADISGGVEAGTYSVTETANPDYVTSISCTGTGGEVETPTAIDLEPGETVTCVFTNTKDEATIHIVKNTLGGNGEFAINWEGPTTSGGVTLDTLDINTDSATVTTTETGTFKLYEVIVPPNWVLSNALCVNDVGGASVGTWDGVQTINNIVLAPGDSVTCTFTNQAVGTVTLVKNTVGGDGSFDFVTNVPGLGANIQTNGGTGSTSAANVPAGTYSIVETVPAGWQLTSATCSDESPPNALVLDLGETVTCTFADTKLGTVIVEKQTLPNGSPQTFGFTGDVSGTIGDGGQIVLGNLVPGTYTSTETPVAGWELTSIICDDRNSTGNSETGQATFNLEAGETVKCVFTNTQDGSIEVVKQLSATGPASETFSFTSSFNGSFNLVGDAATTGPIAVTPGSGYTVSEDDPTLAGWENTDASCGDGSNPLTNIDVSPGEEVVCTFTNTPLGSATIIKNTVGGNGVFGFTGDAPIGPFSLDTTDQFTDTTGDLFDYILSDGVYDVTEDNIPSGFALTDIGCSDASATDLATATASMDVQLNETVTCTFTNTADGTLIIRKETIPDGSEQGFGFSGGEEGLLLHDYSATGEQLLISGQPGVYTSAETVPEGWVITDISCTGDVQSDVTIGANDVSVDLAAGETVICTFENTQNGSITIQKFSRGDLGAFQFNGDFGSFLLDTTGGNPASASYTNLLPDTYMVSEVVPSNWTLSNIECVGATNSTITIGGAGGFNPGDQGVSIDLVAGEDITCVFFNDADGSITLVKNLPNDNGGNAVPSDFTAYIDGNQVAWGVPQMVKPGNYTASETTLPGYAASDWFNACEADGSVIVDPGQDVVCEITNDDIAPTLTLVKTVVNNNGGNLTAANFPSFVDGVPQAWGVATPVTANAVHTASETTQTGYAASAWGGDCAANGTITLLPGENKTCTITNDDIAPTLRLLKTVVNNNGGNLTQANFPSFVNGTPQAWGVVTTFQANVQLTASETPQAGYAASAWGGDCAANGTITLLPGDVKTCTITNDDIAPTLRLLKTVVNNNGGNLTQANFPSFVNGVPQAWGVVTPVLANTVLTASETTQAGYTASAWGGDCAANGTITLLPGDVKTCTITNDDVAPTLRLLKTVVNDNGGNLTQANFPSFVNGTPQAWGVVTPVLANTVLTASETPQAGYAASAWGGDCAANGTITLLPGDVKTCTITNNDIAPKLTLVKTVVNDNGGNLTQANFPAFIDGVAQAWDVAKDVTANAQHTASETPQTGYAASAWGGDCAANGTITLLPGDNKTCTITNNDIAPKLTLVKTVVNDNGGLLTKANFPAFIDGVAQAWDVAKDVTANVQHTASETPQTGYAASAWGGDCAANGTITLLPGDVKTCTITNNDIAPTLTLLKTVVNDNGGTLGQDDFPSFVNGVPQAWGVATPVQANTVLTASETQQTGYAASAWGRDCAENGTITLLPGDNKTCTITNDDIAPTLTLVKQAIGLPDQSFCFTFTGPEDSGEFCIETTNGEGQLSEDVRAGLYSFEEIINGQYSVISMSCDNGDEADAVSLDVGDNVTCTFVNMNIAPVPVNNPVALLLLTLMLLATGWYFRPAVMRRF